MLLRGVAIQVLARVEMRAADATIEFMRVCHANPHAHEAGVTVRGRANPIATASSSLQAVRPVSGRAKKSMYHRGTCVCVASPLMTRVIQESADVSSCHLRGRGSCRGCVLE